MVLGALTELVNAQSLKLEMDNETYVMLQELDFHLGRPEAREPTTNGGVIYYYGKGDHYFDATILTTTPEIKDFNDLITANTTTGELPPKTYKIIATARGGSTSTISITAAVVPDFNMSKPIEGGVVFRVRFRITTDSVSVA